jgi:hypothetical protein
MSLLLLCQQLKVSRVKKAGSLLGL